MGFQVRESNTIITEMISQLVSTNPGVTDFTEGSVARSLLETQALQIQRIETNTFSGIMEGINIGTFQNFNFQRLPASFASGLVTFTATAPQATPQVIPAGTNVEVTGTNNVFTAVQNTILPANATFVNVLCQTATLGSSGNTPANTITTLLSPLSFIASVNNNAPIINGLDQESDSARATRFQNYLLGLSRGTVLSITSAAENVELLDNNGNILEQVAQALVIEPFTTDPTKPLGQIQVYIDNGSGTASGNLVQQVSNVILGYIDSNGFEHDGYIAAGIGATIAAVISQNTNTTCFITVAPGNVPATVAANVQTAITTYIQTLTIGAPVLFAQLITVVMNTSGVTDVVFSQPTADIIVPATFRAVPGTITVLF